MAAVWAFCVGVQAEDMGYLPSPQQGPPPTMGSCTPHSGALLLWESSLIPEESML